MRSGDDVFGRTAAGAVVERFTLESDSGVTVRLLSWGAILQSLAAPDRHGRPAEVTLGFDTLASYAGKHPYLGATVGRYANRIARGRFTLDGIEYTLAVNNGPNHLHGGLTGFDKAVWKAEPFTDAAASGGRSRAGVRFRHLSPDGDEGYPGNLAVMVTYSLDDAGSLRIDYEATTDRPTVVNLTNHAYWNLAGAGSGDVLGHELILAAERFLPVDETLIPTGERRPVAGTPMDFRTGHAIGERIAATGGGYDHCFVLADSPRQVPALAAVLRDPRSGRVMRVLTTEPGIQLYTGNFLDGIHGAGGKVFHRHGALCLEAQRFPDTPNRPEFPSAVLRPGEAYRQTTIHEFAVD
jgi:aldose 1-epimerase